MLIVQNLKKYWGDVKAIDGVSLSFKTGEMTGIIGSSGSGKSTLLRLINRLIDPVEGKIFHEDREVTKLRWNNLRKWRVKCAMIFQHFNLIPRLDVITNVLIGRLCYHNTLSSIMKIFSKKEKAMAIEALEKLDISMKALHRADSLSGGQQQRVAIARALVQEPEFILADEPVASLDPFNAKKVMDSLKKLNKENGITVIISLHHLAWAKEYCDRIIGMSRGKVVYDGKPADLTIDIVREIYGREADKEELESVIKSSIANENSIYEIKNGATA